MKIRLLIAALVLALSSIVLVAVPPDFTSVQNAVNAAPRGGTVNVDAGTATWSQRLYITRGIKLIGAGRTLTIINGPPNMEIIGIEPDSTAFANQETFEIAGFKLDYNQTGTIGAIIYCNGPNTAVSNPARLLIHDNRLEDIPPNSGNQGAVYMRAAEWRGVIWNNEFVNCNVIVRPFGWNNIAAWTGAYPPPPFGSADQLFIEDNQITWQGGYTATTGAWFEGGQGGRSVFRYNTYNYAGYSPAQPTLAEVWDVHGMQNFFSCCPPGQGNYQVGHKTAEFYGNTITGFPGNRWLTHRGGQALFHNNILTGTAGATFEIQQYAVGDQGGSGCDVDSGVPGGQVNDTYGWNNTHNGGQKNLIIGGLGVGCGVTENTAFWNFTSSFNGSVGIGRGTAAPSGAATEGVAYWQASDPNPTVNPSVIQNGILWRRTGGVWTQYYRPYTYPHPLRTGGGGDTTAPSLSTATLQPNGTELVLVFNEAVNQGSGGAGGWTLSMSGGATTLTPHATQQGNGTATWKYVSSRTIGSTETGTLAYVQPNNGLEDVAGNDLASLSGLVVTNQSTQGQVAVPTVDVAGGSYFGNQTITASCATSGAEIRYTTNGSTPTGSSSLYSTPLVFSAPVTLKLIGIKSGSTNSAVSTHVYEINEWTTTSGVLEDIAVPSQIAPVVWKFSVTPNAPNSYTVVSLNDGPRLDNPDAVAVWFTDTGVIQCRNGATYAAMNVVNAAAGVTYTFSGVLDPATDKWDMSVTPAGGSATVLADDYDFRQPETSLNTLTIYTGTGTSVIEQMSLMPPTTDTQPVGTVDVINLTIGAP